MTDINNNISQSEEGIKHHLENPIHSARSLEPWVLNPTINLNIHQFWKEITQQYMEENFKGHSLYDYPLPDEMKGNLQYRKAVSKFLEHFYRHPVEVSTLVATYGATFGFYLVMTEFFEKGDFLFVEDLTYFRILSTARKYGLKIIANSCDDEGINIEEFEDNLKKCQAKNTHEISPNKPYWGMVYLLTQLHNPKGMSYSEARCEKVLELSRKYNVLVITDDVYFPFRNEKKAVGDALVAYDKCNWSTGTGNVVSNGSFSKILFPTLRLGWMEASPWFIRRFDDRQDLKASAGYNTYNQGLAALALSSPKFWKVFQENKTYYAKKLECACDFLQKYLPKAITFKRPEGSFFLWLKLPEGYQAEELLEKCKKYHVKFVLGKRYSSDPNSRKYDNHFRLAVTNLDDTELLMSLHVICTQAASYLGGMKNGFTHHTILNGSS